MKKLIITAVIAILGLIWMLYMSAALSIKTQHTSTTDYYNNDVSEQIQAETQCELKGGIYENSICLPPNLTLAAEKELQAYTAQKQAEINRTLGAK